jgi:hypothetical protein
MDWVEDQILPVIGTRVTGDLLTAAANDDLMDIATDPHLLVTEGDGYRVIIVPIPHQRQGINPRRQFVAGIKRGRRYERRFKQS